MPLQNRGVLNDREIAKISEFIECLHTPVGGLIRSFLCRKEKEPKKHDLPDLPFKGDSIGYEGWPSTSKF
jgi:hypothetical protein